MVVRYKKTPEVPNVIVGDKQIGLVHSYEYLGILLDENLSHNDYVENIWKKTNNNIGILSGIRR